MKRYAVVVNLKARRAKSRHKRFKAQLSSMRLQVVFEEYLEDPAQLETVLLQALDSKPDVLIVGGGDGTVTAAAGLLANHQETALSIIPMGTANYFARNLKIPMSLDGAVSVIKGGKETGVPLGRINNRYFTFMADIGVTTRVASTVSDRTKRYLGPAAYLGNFSRQFFGHKWFRTELSFDGDIHTFKTHQLVIMNADLNQQLKIVPKTSLHDDSLLLVSYAKDDHRLMLHLWNFFFFMATKGKRKNSIRTHNFQRATITTYPRRTISIDGELAGTTPATCLIVDDALRVIARDPTKQSAKAKSKGKGYKISGPKRKDSKR